jgi:hypothetical protein
VFVPGGEDIEGEEGPNQGPKVRKYFFKYTVHVSVPSGEDMEGEEEPTQIIKVREYIVYNIFKNTVQVSVPGGEDKEGEEEPARPWPPPLSCACLAVAHTFPPIKVLRYIAAMCYIS